VSRLRENSERIEALRRLGGISLCTCDICEEVMRKPSEPAGTHAVWFTDEDGKADFAYVCGTRCRNEARRRYRKRLIAPSTIDSW